MYNSKGNPFRVKYHDLPEVRPFSFVFVYCLFYKQIDGLNLELCFVTHFVLIFRLSILLPLSLESCPDQAGLEFGFNQSKRGFFFFFSIEYDLHV